MKKLLIITCAMCVLAGAASANEAPCKKEFAKNGITAEQTVKKMPSPEQIKQNKRAHEAAFEQKLGLTEVQKLKARELRKAGHQKMKPVMEQIRVKKQEAETIRNSKISVQEQEEKLTVIDKDLGVLQKQAQEIRKQNMKDFESILTKDQKKTLKNMKKEGRKNFDEHRKQLPPPPCKPMERK